jgi:hypothetical protein
MLVNLVSGFNCNNDDIKFLFFLSHVIKALQSISPIWAYAYIIVLISS